MVSAHDVAHYILERRAMSAMKLQKLVYYAQAWHLARRGKPLFGEQIEAWVNGPVVRELYDVHRGQFSMSAWPCGDGDALSQSQRRLVDEVLTTYGTHDASWLSQLTHSEDPWRRARYGLPDNARSSAVIDTADLERFYAAQEAAGRGPVDVA